MTHPLGLIPYAQQFLIVGEMTADGAPFTATVSGLDIPDVVREHSEEMSREYFHRTHPGAVIAREEWQTLYELSDPEGDDE